jgi:hypothetical protein
MRLEVVGLYSALSISASRDYHTAHVGLMYVPLPITYPYVARVL